MRTINYGNWPADRRAQQEAFEKNLAWVAAIDISDYGDDRPLLKLIGGQSPIPLELRPAIAAALAGSRGKRNASKSKVPVRERLMIACTISEMLGLVDKLKDNRLASGTKWIEEAADIRGCEPRDVLRELEDHADAYIRGNAADLGVHVETIKNLVRDLRKKMASYPNV